MKKLIVSGIQPTGPLHIGNYLGSIKNFVKLQNDKKFESYFFIADYHSITENFNPKEKSAQILNLMAEYLAIGLDPKKCVLFAQSGVPEVTELAWMFNCVTPISFLERMTQYKDKAARQKENINTGLFDYPVLQAADILIYGKDTPVFVPVGQDQIQHVELTRDIAKFFNNKFGKTFAEPQPLLTPIPRLMSLLEPERKMSKSLGADHCIFLFDEPEEIERKIKRAVTSTDPGGEMSAGVKNLFLLLENFGSKKDYLKFKKEYDEKTIRYSDLKQVLAKSIADYFADFREARKKLLKNPAKIMKIFSSGAVKSRKLAQKTMKDVRKKTGLI
jgi:tryptophanyl-tRNA synthetase